MTESTVTPSTTNAGKTNESKKKRRKKKDDKKKKVEREMNITRMKQKTDEINHGPGHQSEEENQPSTKIYGLGHSMTSISLHRRPDDEDCHNDCVDVQL